MLTPVPAPPAPPSAAGQRGREGTRCAGAPAPAPPRAPSLRGGRPRLQGAQAIGDSRRRREEKSNKRARRQTRDLGKGEGGGEGGDGHTPPQPPHQQPRPAWVPRFRWSIWEPMKRQEGGGSEPAGREGLNHVLRVLLWAVTHLQTGL